MGQSLEDHDSTLIQRADEVGFSGGQRVSIFVVVGATTDEIYAGYRLLTGDTPMLPKGAYGLIQCKQRYSTQEEMLG